MLSLFKGDIRRKGEERRNARKGLTSLVSKIHRDVMIPDHSGMKRRAGLRSALAAYDGPQSHPVREGITTPSPFQSPFSRIGRVQSEDKQVCGNKSPFAQLPHGTSGESEGMMHALRERGLTCYLCHEIRCPNWS